MPFTRERCAGLGQPVDVFTELGKVTSSPYYKLQGRMDRFLVWAPWSACCFSGLGPAGYAKCWQLDLLFPYTQIQLFTLHKVGVTPCEVGHFTVDHMHSHGKCLFTWQSCGESSFRWGWMLNRNQSDACLFYANETSFVLRWYSFTVALK